MKRLIPIFALSISLATTLPANAQPVVGGNSVTSSADFFCSLTLPSIPGYAYLMCGASLIHPQWVLTAGHCTFDPSTYQPQQTIDVIIAPYLPASGASYARIRSAKIVAHKNYSLMGQGYDIALIKLKTPVTSVMPIALPAQGDNSLTAGGAACKIVGFGIYDINNLSAQPDTLQYAQIEIIDNNTCNQPSMYGGDIEPSMLCAGMLTGGPKGGAAGDSGGPLWVTTGSGDVQVGLVSFGAGDYSTTTHPGVFTRISSYRQWIDSVINADSTVSVNDIPVSKAAISRTENAITATLEEQAVNDLHYTIYNYEGRTVRSGMWTKGKKVYHVDAADLQHTLYFIHITDNRNYLFTGKVPVLR